MIYTEKEKYDRDKADFVEAATGNMADEMMRQFEQAADEAYVRDGDETTEDEYQAEEKRAQEAEDKAVEIAEKEFDDENELYVWYCNHHEGSKGLPFVYVSGEPQPITHDYHGKKIKNPTGLERLKELGLSGVYRPVEKAKARYVTWFVIPSWGVNTTSIDSAERAEDVVQIVQSEYGITSWRLRKSETSDSWDVYSLFVKTKRTGEEEYEFRFKLWGEA